MNSTPDKPSEHRNLTNQQELAQRIAERLTHDGRLEVCPGLFFNRSSAPTLPAHTVAEPCLCVIAQGSKAILVGRESFRYDPAHYLIATMEVPMAGQVVEATADEPYLSIRLDLDPSIVTSVMIEAGHVPNPSERSVAAVDVSRLETDLLDATLRLVRMVDRPNEYAMLAPAVTREIIYRLLIGAQGDRLRHLTRFGGTTHRMAQAIQTIRRNFDKPIRIEDLARQIHMSVSGFHMHFKTVTAMTPLQFQKQLRLQEARRLMLAGECDAAQAGFQVGYEDASHFSREYKRQFGNPPMRDIEMLLEAGQGG